MMTTRIIMIQLQNDIASSQLYTTNWLESNLEQRGTVEKKVEQELTFQQLKAMLMTPHMHSCMQEYLR